MKDNKSKKEQSSYSHVDGNLNTANASYASTSMSKLHAVTIHSVEIEDDGRDKRNAVEIMQNGDVYIIGIGGYNGYACATSYTLQESIGVGRKDKNSENGTGEVFNDMTLNKAIGNYSHAEGSCTRAKGEYSHAEGIYNEAIGNGSHAEGATNKAIGELTHVEGRLTKADGDYSHSEGNVTLAMGEASHSEGEGTMTKNNAEHAEGLYNESHDKDTPEGMTIHSIGIGTADRRRLNAVEVMRNGDMYIKGVGEYDGVNIDNVKTIQATISEMKSSIDKLCHENALLKERIERMENDNHAANINANRWQTYDEANDTNADGFVPQAESIGTNCRDERALRDILHGTSSISVKIDKIISIIRHGSYGKEIKK